ncbi:MAG: hypothetical protein Ct9H300mP12_08270 [Acidimicrobiales bacterium]|nr:MAG: hypothetical protein Ct9H300mP12_08270 [Acidimicrobiales bacterium]
MGRAQAQGCGSSCPRTARETHPGSLAEDAVAIVARWLTEAHAAERPAEARLADQMRSIIDDPVGVGFTMRFVDRVARHRSDALAAEQLVDLVGNGDLPGFLGWVDRLLLRVGARLAPGPSPCRDAVGSAAAASAGRAHGGGCGF